MKTDWKDDMFEGNLRRYTLINNDDGTVSLQDATDYTQQGDAFGANELNAIGAEVNETKKSVSDGKTLIAAAITAKRVAAAASDTFAVLANKIGQIVLGSGNAAKADVLKGKTFTNNDGVEYTGTMENKSGTTQSASASLDTANSHVIMTVPATGKYDTASKLYATYATIRTLIGLTADKLWYNTTILGLKSSRSGLAAKTYMPGTANQTIAAGTCITGTQTIKGDANLKAANIKKGVTIFGIAGTWEGYVATDELIYNLGAEKVPFSVKVSNTAAYAPNVRKDATCVTIYEDENGASGSSGMVAAFAGMVSNSVVSLANISKIRVTFSGKNLSVFPQTHYVYIHIHSTDSGVSASEKAARLYNYVDGTYNWTSNTDFTLDLDVSSLTGSYYIKAGYYCKLMGSEGEVMHIKKIQLLS